MKYKSIKELNTDFSKGKIKDLPAAFSIDNIEYKFSDSPPYEFKEIIDKGAEEHAKKPVVIYAVSPGKENKKLYDEKHTSADDVDGFQDRIVFIWAAVRLHVRPVAAKFISKGRMSTMIVRENDDARVIGDVVEVKFTNLPQPVTLRGKVDTGAAMCSLHADKSEINEKTGQVSFVAKQISPNTITVKLQDKQAIGNAEGTEYRPVIALNVQVNGKNYPDVLFNLNDRSKMEHKLLIGQNLLEKGKFLIDPTINEEAEEVDWDMVQEQFKDINIEDNDIKDTIYELMGEVDFSFSDLANLITKK